MRIQHPTNNSSSLIQLQDQTFLERQRIAGQVAAGALTLLEGLVKERTQLTMLELDKVAEEYIRQQGCSPTFLSYHGFPASVCISVNQALVHGIPTDYRLQEGDVVSFDLGATFEGAIADTALTTVFGETKPEHIKGVNAVNKCLEAAIASISVGKRLGVIGHTIWRTARELGFDVIQAFGGHGISRTSDNIGIPHAQPFVANKANQEDGIRLQANMTLAIEPLLVPAGSSTATKTGSDGWTVYTETVSFHCEDSIFIHPDRVEILTQRDKHVPN